MGEFESLIELKLKIKLNELEVNKESYSKKLNEIKTKFGLDSKYNFIIDVIHICSANEQLILVLAESLCTV